MPTLQKPPGNEFLERLIRLFLWAETSIINTLGGLRSRGLADYHAEAALGRVRGILRKLLEGSQKYVPQMIERQFYARHPEQRKRPETVEKHRRAYQNAEALTIGQTAVAERLMENLLGEITESAVTVEGSITKALRAMAIGRLEPDIFRQVGLSQVSAMEALGRGPNSMVNEFCGGPAPGGRNGLCRQSGAALEPAHLRRYGVQNHQPPSGGAFRADGGRGAGPIQNQFPRHHLPGVRPL